MNHLFVIGVKRFSTPTDVKDLVNAVYKVIARNIR